LSCQWTTPHYQTPQPDDETVENPLWRRDLVHEIALHRLNMVFEVQDLFDSRCRAYVCHPETIAFHKQEAAAQKNAESSFSAGLSGHHKDPILSFNTFLKVLHDEK
jgi:hypothetical protein